MATCESIKDKGMFIHVHCLDKKVTLPKHTYVCMHIHMYINTCMSEERLLLYYCKNVVFACNLQTEQYAHTNLFPMPSYFNQV